MVEADLKKLVRTERVEIDLAAFEAIYEARLKQSRLDIPKALDTNFNVPRNPAEKRIRELIEQYRTQKHAEHVEGIQKQKDRLIDVDRRLAKKTSESGLREKRIATDKLEWHEKKLKDLDRVERRENDSRIYPQWYAPVIVQVGNDRLIRPMRYLCRPADKPAFIKVQGKPLPYEVKFQGCYNARRDNLEGFWKVTFGQHHAYMVISSFFENVALNDFEHRELRQGEEPKNLVIQFKPKPETEMRVACLWSRCENGDKGILESFAAITDEPPPEVKAAGHDRCLIPLTQDSIETWLRPQGASLESMYAALDNRVRPYYEHKLAA